MPQIIATEEAFVTREIMQAWRELLDDGAPGEPGLAHFIGMFLDPPGEWAARAAAQLLDLGELRLKHMDEGGVDMQLISLTAPGVQVFDSDTACALARESNDALAETVRKQPRFAGLAAVAPQAPKSAARELERSIGLGLKGLLVNSHTKGEYLDAISFRPLLEAAESLDVPIYIHPRTAPPAMQAPFAERHFAGAFWGFQSDTAMHALRLIVTGVFDRFPKLKIVLGHLGEGLPFWLDRLDRQYSRTPRKAYPYWRARRLPSEYFLSNFYVTSSGHNWDPAVRFVEEVIGEDHLLFGVDYPYESCQQQVEQSRAINLKNLDKFYELNARAVFKIT